jgi:hypothetical protein
VKLSLWLVKGRERCLKGYTTGITHSEQLEQSIIIRHHAPAFQEVASARTTLQAVQKPD